MFRRVGALVAAVLLIFAVAPPPTASAACGANGNWFVGRHQETVSGYGAAAVLSRSVPALCGSSHSDSSAWAMLESQKSGEYAQAGYGRSNGQTTVYHFAEYTTATSFVRKITGAVRGSTSYAVDYDTVAAKVYMNAGGTNLLTSTREPALYWTSPWGQQFLAEVHNTGDSSPGTAAAKMNFSSVRYKSNRYGSWAVPPGLQNAADLAKFHEQTVSSASFNIWTQ
jgi:hypothetical protein